MAGWIDLLLARGKVNEEAVRRLRGGSSVRRSASGGDDQTAEILDVGGVMGKAGTAATVTVHNGEVEVVAGKSRFPSISELVAAGLLSRGLVGRVQEVLHSRRQWWNLETAQLPPRILGLEVIILGDGE